MDRIQKQCKQCDYCGDMFEDYHIEMNIKGVGDKIEETDYAHFCFCDMECAEGFLHDAQALKVGCLDKDLERVGIEM